MKRSVLIIILLCFQSVVIEAATMQYYINGAIEYATDNSIRLNGNTYTLSPKVIIRAHEKHGNSLYEVPGKMSEVTTGTPVYLRIEGTTIYEVIVVRSN